MDILRTPGNRLLARRRPGAPCVAVVRRTGTIGAVGGHRSGLTLAGLTRVLDRAFKLRHLSAVALSINSPGGSAVQSGLIAARIRALAVEHNVPVIAFVEDVAASGGYWLACAADEILAHEASIVGSIGVVARSEEHTSELQSLMRSSYAALCLKKKTPHNTSIIYINTYDINKNP